MTEKAAARRAKGTWLFESKSRGFPAWYITPTTLEKGKLPYGLCNQRVFIRNKYKPDVKSPLVKKLMYFLWVFSHIFSSIVIEVFCLCMDQGNRETGKKGRAWNGKDGLNNNKKIFWPLATCTW